MSKYGCISHPTSYSIGEFGDGRAHVRVLRHPLHHTDIMPRLRMPPAEPMRAGLSDGRQWLDTGFAVRDGAIIMRSRGIKPIPLRAGSFEVAAVERTKSGGSWTYRLVLRCSCGSRRIMGIPAWRGAAEMGGLACDACRGAAQ